MAACLGHDILIKTGEHQCLWIDRMTVKNILRINIVQKYSDELKFECFKTICIIDNTSNKSQLYCEN